MWTIEKVKMEASLCRTKAEFRKNKALSSAASRLGVYHDIADSLLGENREDVKSMSKEDIIAVANTCTRSEFRKKHSGMSKMLTADDFENIYGKYEYPSKYTDSELVKTGLTYKTRNSFKKGDYGAYQAACKRNLEDAFSHMGRSKSLKYNFDELCSIASSYTSKNNFKLGSYGAYQAACRNKRFDEICSHMVPGKIAVNYNKPMFLYIVKITTISTGDNVYKIGITKRSYVLDRFWIDYNKKDTTIVVLAKTKFKFGKDAYTVEQMFKNQFKHFAYTGVSPLLRTKTTEMFTVDITRSKIR